MPIFGGLNQVQVTNQIANKLAALIAAFEDLENTYQWCSAYALADLEAAPLSYAAADGQDILNALADAHDLWMTAQGTTGFPTAVLPYPFTASMRVIVGPR